MRGTVLYRASSSFCYTTNGLYSNRDTYYSGGKCVNIEMSEVVTVKLSPNRSNIMYVERRTTDLETDFSESLMYLEGKAERHSQSCCLLQNLDDM